MIVTRRSIEILFYVEYLKLIKETEAKASVDVGYYAPNPII